MKVLLISLFVLAPLAGAVLAAPKQGGVFYPASLREAFLANAQRDPWIANLRDQAVQAAQPWLAMTDEALWASVFGPTIPRSWMVWSDGFCPACHKSVPMYSWRMNAMRQPWKVRCPHCEMLFPTNDFEAFYRSGLDAAGIFDPALADRSLLFNTDHPDSDDPLHTFGVDDGTGYIEGEHRWRFVGTYLIYGQWYQVIMDGVRNLSAAYVATGEARYAHKAAILLDRIADVYPSMSFAAQGWVYETTGDNDGYVTNWHNACEDTREMALAWDAIRSGLAGDAALVAFLSSRAAAGELTNPKASLADIERNIADGLLRDPLTHPERIHSNYPRNEIARIVLMAVDDWAANRARIDAILDEVLAKTTAVDGVTGEKGLANYSAYTIQNLALLLGQLDRLDESLLAELFARHPQLAKTWRFHIDTRCLGQYYPNIGDSGIFGKPFGLSLPQIKQGHPGVSPYACLMEPSSFTFLWRLYELTGDPAYVQILYQANGGHSDNLPHDPFAADPAAFQEKVDELIEKVGTEPAVGSMNFEQWRLGILRSGEGVHRRALWMDYDVGGSHGQRDGLNLGLFALGLDLMPDFGYPPVQYGGWHSPRVEWYRSTGSHNTVVVDGRNQSQRTGDGETTLWCDGLTFRAMAMSGPGMYKIDQYERLAAMVDLDEKFSYVLDVFWVNGKSDHAKFMHSFFGSATAEGLNLAPAEEYGHGAIMRNFRADPAAQPGWSVTWDIEDYYGVLPPGTADVHLRYTDLTVGAEAALAEAWISPGAYNETKEAWIPRVMVRRRSEEAPLVSTFVGVIEPYAGRPGVDRVRRLEVSAASQPEGEPAIGVELTLTDGRRDILLAANPKLPPETAVSTQAGQTPLELVGRVAWVRIDKTGAVQSLALANASRLRVGELEIVLSRPEFVEIAITDGHVQVLAGPADAIARITLGDRPLTQTPGQETRSQPE